MISKEELEEYKKSDPIELLLTTMRQNKWIEDSGVEEMETKVKALVDESVKFADESPFPDANEIYNDVYVQKDYPYIKD